MDTCYWCGLEVLHGEGNREHLVPKTLFQGTNEDLGFIIIEDKNSHTNCNSYLGNSHEHDFCQLLFHYTVKDPIAAEHTESKIRNLKSKPNYTRNQFAKMKLLPDNQVKIALAKEEMESFTLILEKIIKGLYFKTENKFLDLKGKFCIEPVWSAPFFQSTKDTQQKLGMLRESMKNTDYIGNRVFKYKYTKVHKASSSLWELLFYERLPVFIFLFHNNERSNLSLLKKAN